MRLSLPLAVLALLSCGEPQPWPMGFWSGTSTLVHLPTMTVTTSPIEVVSYYPGYNAGLGVDDPRFVFSATLSDRTIGVSGQPSSNTVSTFGTRLDGGIFVATGVLAGTADTLRFDVAWSARDAGPGEPAVYTERASLRRVKDYDLSRPGGAP
ncbi:MAG: hypothetical protein JNM69_24675 [Archangium sp.]|nr:hypothetical protein [Archangium sp.]